MVRSGQNSLDLLKHHVRAAFRPVFVHKQILGDQKVRVKEILRFLDLVIFCVDMSGWACIVYHSDLWCLDVAGAPGNPRDWNLKN